MGQPPVAHANYWLSGPFVIQDPCTKLYLKVIEKKPHHTFLHICVPCKYQKTSMEVFSAVMPNDGCKTFVNFIDGFKQQKHTALVDRSAEAVFPRTWHLVIVG